MEDHVIEQALGDKGQEFSEWARPVLVNQALRDIEKGKKR